MFGSFVRLFIGNVKTQYLSQSRKNFIGFKLVVNYGTLRPKTL